MAAGLVQGVEVLGVGGCPSDAEEWLTDACPIVGSFGGSDNSPLGSRAGRRLGQLLTEFNVPHDVKICPGVGNGFMNDHEPKDQTLLLRFLARASGTEYDEEATRDARRRIIEFFNCYLKNRPGGPNGAPPLQS